MSNDVLVVGSGTIGLPLIGMLSRHKDRLGIDSVMFNKNTPLEHDAAQIKKMIALGAELVTDQEKFEGFKALGMPPVCTKEEAVNRAAVVVDCTPKGVGLSNKREYYEKYSGNTKGFIAQGSENGFGSKYGYNLVDFPDDQFVQIVSCNTHSIAAIIKSFENVFSSASPGGIISGDFVCMRRSNDISQNGGFIPSINPGKHDDEVFGTHHARDVFDLMKRDFPHISLYSSAIKLNTQYMHTIRFSVELDSVNSNRVNSDADALFRFAENPMVALTNKATSNQAFSFGREFGLYGRILSQSIVCRSTVSVRKNVANHSIISGMAYTSQDGNSLVSSIYAILCFLDPEAADERIKIYDPYIFQEI